VVRRVNVVYNRDGGNKPLVETGGEGLEELSGRLAELSERHIEHARALVEDIEERRREARERDMNFAALDADQLLLRLKSARTPFLYASLSNYRTPSPGTFHAAVGVSNPDDVATVFLYVHFFVGPSSLVADIGQALELVDTRFPRAIEPDDPGLSIPPNDLQWVWFELPLSGHIEESHYIANILLIRQSPFELGELLDRGSILFKVRDTPMP